MTAPLDLDALCSACVAGDHSSRDSGRCGNDNAFNADCRCADEGHREAQLDRVAQLDRESWSAHLEQRIADLTAERDEARASCAALVEALTKTARRFYPEEALYACVLCTGIWGASDDAAHDFTCVVATHGAAGAAMLAEHEQRKREADCFQKLANLIDGFSWLAEGRGSYAYDDPGYDADVHASMQQLIDAADATRWEPYQTVLNRMYEAEGTVRAMLAELVALRRVRDAAIRLQRTDGDDLASLKADAAALDEALAAVPK